MASLKASTGPNTPPFRRSGTLAAHMAKQQQQQQEGSPASPSVKRVLLSAATFHGAGPENFKTVPQQDTIRPSSAPRSALASSAGGGGGGGAQQRGRFATAAPPGGRGVRGGAKLETRTAPVGNGFDNTWDSCASTQVPASSPGTGSPFSPQRQSSLARQIKSQQSLASGAGSPKKMTFQSSPFADGFDDPADGWSGSGRQPGVSFAASGVSGRTRGGTAQSQQSRPASSARSGTRAGTMQTRGTAKSGASTARSVRKTTMQSSQSEKSLRSSGDGANFGASGERLAPTKWKTWANMVDKQTLGAHYDYIVGHLQGSFAADLHEEVRDYDDLCHDTLHKKHPEDPVHPRAGSPRPAATAAFSDRALRLREGKGARAAMMPKEVEEPSPPQCAATCSCSVCNPHTHIPAGQPSHLVHYHRAPRCGKDHHVDQQLSHTFHSGLLTSALNHTGGALVPPEFEEAHFVKSMGRKSKPPGGASPGGGGMMLHRSMSCDVIPSAGDHNQELAAEISTQRNRRRQDWQGRSGSLPPRHGAALAVHPSDDDPPAPTRISSCQRARGEFKDGFSDEAARLTAHFNQEHYRFSDSNFVRGRSQPPPMALDESIAGRSTGLLGSHSWGQGNPLTMTGKDKTVSALGGGSPSFRRGLGNTSHAVGFTTNQDVCGMSFAMETDHRMRTEPEFAALCAAAGANAEFTRTAGSLIKDCNGHSSAEIRTHLAWAEE